VIKGDNRGYSEIYFLSQVNVTHAYTRMTSKMTKMTIYTTK